MDTASFFNGRLAKSPASTCARARRCTSKEGLRKFADKDGIEKYTVEICIEELQKSGPMEVSDTFLCPEELPLDYKHDDRRIGQQKGRSDVAFLFMRPRFAVRCIGRSPLIHNLVHGGGGLYRLAFILRTDWTTGVLYQSPKGKGRRR